MKIARSCFRLITLRFLALSCVACVGPLAAGESIGPSSAPIMPGPFASPPPGIQAPNDPHRFEDIFVPFTTDTASLSPDGKYLAYSILAEGMLYVVVVAVDNPGKFLAKVAVNSTKGAQSARTRLREDRPPIISWMGWSSPTRLVVFIQTRSGPALMAFDADGSNVRVLATSRTRATLNGYQFFGRSAEPDAVLIRQLLSRFFGAGGAKVYINYEYLRLDTVTGKFTEIDEASALDEQRRVKQAAQAVRHGQSSLMRDVKEIAAGREVAILESDEAEVRFLGLLQAPGDPGSFCVIDRERNAVFDLVPRMPGFKPAHDSVMPFEFTASDGQKVSGEVMLPREPKISHAPVVVFMPAAPGLKMVRGFSREAQVFARMGLASVRFDSFIPKVAPRDATRDYERQLIAEVVRLVDGLPALHAVSKRSVVLFGESRAGYFALRAMQIEPVRFIAAVAVAPWVSQESWNDPKLWPENAGKPRGPSGIKRPLLFVNTPSMSMARLPVIHALIREAKQTGIAAELSEQPLDFSAHLPLARAAGFRDIERFINANVYQFTVKLHELEVKP